jgi:hypothetical protein
MINVRRILPAIKHLCAELEPFEKQAQAELKNKDSHAIGIIRLDLIEECRRRLAFLKYMKGAEEHADERPRNVTEQIAPVQPEVVPGLGECAHRLLSDPNMSCAVFHTVETENPYPFDVVEYQSRISSPLQCRTPSAFAIWSYIDSWYLIPNG